MPEGSIFGDTFDLGGGTDLFDVGEGNLFTDDGATVSPPALAVDTSQNLATSLVSNLAG